MIHVHTFLFIAHRCLFTNVYTFCLSFLSFTSVLFVHLKFVEDYYSVPHLTSMFQPLPQYHHDREQMSFLLGAMATPINLQSCPLEQRTPNGSCESLFCRSFLWPPQNSMQNQGKWYGILRPAMGLQKPCLTVDNLFIFMKGSLLIFTKIHCYSL